MSRTLMLLLLLAAFATGAQEIRGDKFANWYILGEEVRFKTGTPLSGNELAVTLFDSAGKQLLRQSVTVEEFNRSGWSFRPAAPGFYEAEFLLDGKAVSESYPVGIRRQDPVDKRKYHPVARKDFTVTRHAFAVAPAATPEPRDISFHFGASPHFSMYKKAIPLARLIGFSSIRIHAIRWDQVEKEKGKINWNSVDDFMRLARECGYRDEEIIFNVYGTPRWASPRPEADWINIFLPEYIAMAPRELEDWTNFLRQLMRRYPKVTRYELWNEPHLVGFSCFWYDSVENFVALLKAGYETVKEEKPDSVVWLGGIGMRYLPFYEEFLKAGGGAYYDVLPLHGSWVRPEPFHELEKKFGVPEKPVVSSEWHAMLLKPYEAEFPSEQLLARNMILDFLNQIRAGVEEVDFFCLLNLYRTEKETLPFHREHRSHHTHVSGLFRQVPYIQPRYPALAWHIFTMQVKGRLKVGEGFIFDGIRAIRLQSDSGPMLMVWNSGEQTAALPPELKRVLSARTRILSSEGAELSTESFTLAPEVHYFIRNPEAAEWPAARGEVLLAQNARLVLENKVNGVYRPGALFDDELKTVAPETLKWQPVEHTVIYEPQLPAGKAKGRFAAGITGNRFELLLEAEDPVHVMEEKGIKVWEFDSLQFAIDTKGEGHAADRLEFAAALGRDGKATLWKVFAPGLGGDLPGRYTIAGEQVEYARCRIERNGGKTVYRISLEPSELAPFEFSRQPRLRLALLLNNNDGKGRAAYVEWGSGIGNAKDPRLYGNLTPQLPEGALLTQKDLKHKSWNKDDYELEFRNSGEVRVIGKSPLCSGVVSHRVPVVPGGTYRVTLEVRGNARFQVLANGEGIKRIDLQPALALTEEWKRLELPLQIPPEGRSASIVCFAWQQPGCEFEIRNFKLEPR